MAAAFDMRLRPASMANRHGERFGFWVKKFQHHRLPVADFNHDGFVNGDDYDAFAEHFDAGC